MTHRRTRQNRHTKNRRYRRQKGGDLFTNQSTPPTQPSQNNENFLTNTLDTIGNTISGAYDGFVNWLDKPWSSENSTPTGGKKRKHRKTYKK
jgi:hypothetical protein